MPERRTTPRAPRQTIDARRVFRWADSDDFTRTYFGEPGFASVGAARAAWPQYRRLVWAECHRFTLPRPAEVFDELTLGGLEAIRATWNHVVFPAADVVAAIAADRANLDAFEARDPRGARAIADFLVLLRADLDEVERAARTLADFDGPPWQRPCPHHHLSTSARYGGDGGRNP